jgi:hypothetical protein
LKQFTDRTGRSWTIEANVSSLRRVQAATGIDLTRLADPQDGTLGRLTGDLFALFDCLCALVQPQLTERNVSTEQFGEALDEASAERAVVALLEAVIDFFQDGKRTLLKRALSKVTAAAERVRTQSLDQALRAIESPEFDRALQTALQRESTSGNSSTSSPGLSGSSPDR